MKEMTSGGTQAGAKDYMNDREAGEANKAN